MKCKFEKSEVRMEVLCSLDLWIWSFTFGLSGALYELNIHKVSPHFASVLSENFQLCHHRIKSTGSSMTGSTI